MNCHFETDTPVWGAANFSNADSDCDNCHGYPGSTTGTHANSGSHAKHASYWSWSVNGCIKCHPDHKTGPSFSHATSAGKRGISVTLGEGAYSGTGLNYLPRQSANRTLGSCANLYCQSGPFLLVPSCGLQSHIAPPFPPVPSEN